MAAAGSLLPRNSSATHRDIARRLRDEAARHYSANEDFSLALHVVRDLTNRKDWPPADPDDCCGRRWREIVNVVERAMTESAAPLRGEAAKTAATLPARVRRRTQNAVHLAILWGVHNRLEHVRRRGNIEQEALLLTSRVEALIALALRASSAHVAAALRRQA